MDYFYVGNHGGSVGLQDHFLKFGYKGKKFSAGLQGHYFMAAEDVLDKEALRETGEYKAMDSGLGTEIDLFVGFDLARGVKLKTGYSQMFATETMEALKGGNKEEVQNWGWMMVTMKPKFLEEGGGRKEEGGRGR